MKNISDVRMVFTADRKRINPNAEFFKMISVKHVDFTEALVCAFVCIYGKY